MVFCACRLGSHRTRRLRYFLRISLTNFWFALFLGSNALAQGPINYSVTDATSASPIANPERGFYKNLSTSFSDFKPLRRDDLNSLYEAGDELGNQKISIVLRLYYLEKFQNAKDISKAIPLIRADLAIIRSVGVKAILRFSYCCKNGQLKENDAPVEKVEKHLQQLKSVFQEFKDVIAVVQAGFLGKWGEWFYTRKEYGVAFPKNCPLNPNRRRVIAALLSNIPAEIPIQLRSSYYKSKYDINESRIGFHNDALGGDLFQQRMVAIDEGPPNCNSEGSKNSIIDCDKNPKENLCQLMSAQTTSVPMGGEVGDGKSKDDPGYLIPEKYNWQTISNEFAQNHWSYLDPRNDQMEIKNAWTGHFTETNNRLGYRFVLISSDFRESINQGDDFTVTLRTRNVGWSSPFKQRVVKFILRPKACEGQLDCRGELHAAMLTGDTDPRKWLPSDPLDGIGKQSTYQFSGTFKNVPLGTYYVLVKLADPTVEDFYLKNSADCKANSQKCLYSPLTIGRYSIQFANKEEYGFKWEKESGLNRLGIVEVR